VEGNERVCMENLLVPTGIIPTLTPRSVVAFGRHFGTLRQGAGMYLELPEGSAAEGRRTLMDANELAERMKRALETDDAIRQLPEGFEVGSDIASRDELVAAFNVLVTEQRFFEITVKGPWPT
jgi:hypothetical protein